MRTNQLLTKSFITIYILTALFLFSVYIGLFFYVDLFAFITTIQDKEFHFAIVFTLVTSLISAAIIAIIAIPVGYVLAKVSFPLKNVISSLFDLPLILPSLVTGVALLLFFGPLTSDFLNTLGVRVVFTPVGVVIAQVVIGLPLAVRACQQAFSSYDARFEKVAATLGYSPFQVFLRTSLPMAKSGIWSGVIMAWARAMGEFGAISMVAGMTKFKTETVSIAIFLKMSIGEIQFSVAISIVMILIAIIILTVIRIFEGAEER
ncbi:ABC transporter permease [Alkalihalobacterium chitinilyticum]|uniref:ABC transporter permease n=1 Tax=Alkalihalobacterium chitinilyticum TaxID=2980103 RepID=A0ABT5VK16_9BACI|nr:ABC transporter permease [Alkalihalobacterium chitinilyticum]MDE5415652.1 ABC transporter permease [Alkalihalobacterium chitinilyticum]